MKQCPTCQQPTDTVKAIAHDGKVLRGCDNCLRNQVQGNELVAQHNRDYQKAEYRKDIIQSFDDPRGYIKHYPERAKEVYNADTLRKYG